MILNTKDILIADQMVDGYNKRLNNLMHMLEDPEKLTGPHMLKIASRIRKVRIARRKWKNITFVANQIGPQHMTKLAEVCSRQESNMNKWKQKSEKGLKDLLNNEGEWAAND